MIGRLLGGVATSLLFSIFEAWLIRSHADAQLKNYLGKSFSWAAFSNSIVAILTGLVANKAAESFSMTAIQEEFLYIGGYLSPFDMALVTSLLTSLAAVLMWEENYGDRNDSTDDATVGNKENNAKWYEGLRSAYTTMVRSEDILLCGAISSLFEGSMYVSTQPKEKQKRKNGRFCPRPDIVSREHWLFRSLCLCGHRPCRAKTWNRCPLARSLPRSWSAAWLEAVFLASLVTNSKAKCLALESLALHLLPWESLPSLADKR